MPARIDKETGEELPDSNEILNILLMVLGGLFIAQGIISILGSFGVVLPEILTTSLEGGTSQAAKALLGASGYTATAMGIFAFIGGVGMFKEEEWALGMSLPVLALITINAVTTILAMGFAFNIGFIINISGALIGAFGFVSLIMTAKRYD